MALRAVSRREQRGAALVALAAILVLGVSWMIISALGSVSQRTSTNREHNARVQAEAKAALAAWVAINALDGTENNPGRLPCPQAWGDVGSANEGRAASSCSVPAAGWLPWRTLGLQKPLDASGNQIWYVISPGWHLPASGATLTINSNTAGQLMLDGQAAVALLIAPGPPLAIAPNANQLAAGCAARSQSQALALPGTAPNPLDFLDCQNGSTADGVFAASVVDNAVNPVFNDQVLAITTADILRPLEAAIAKRIERDIVPSLKGVYAGSEWGLSATNPVFPFAAPFANPGPGVGTSNFRGLAGTFEGLLPFNQTQGCTASASNPRCLPSLLSFAASPLPDAFKTAGSGLMSSEDCTFDSSVSAGCTIEIRDGNATIAMTAVIINVAMGLRSLSLAGTELWQWSSGWQPISGQSLSATLSSSGAATMRVQANLTAPNPGSNFYYIRLYLTAAGDHPLLDTTTLGAGSSGWFVRNEWFRLLYYATAPNHAASGAAPRSCSSITPTCLQVANVTPANKQRSILLVAGRSLTGSARPNATLADFVEGANAALPPKTAFEQRVVNSSFNDRVVVVDANP